jgi:transcription termination/antitermination protein NusG
VTDDPNMVSQSTSAELPPEANPGPVEALAAPTPPVDQPAVEQTPSPVQEMATTEPPAAAEAAASEATPPVAAATPAEPVEEAKSDKMDWYILKVQSNREESIREGLLRRVAIAGLGAFFGDVIVPTEKVTEFKGGKKKVIKRKL